MNAFTYLRASTKKQTESVPTQRKMCKDFARDKGYTIVEEFVDTMSGYKFGKEAREGYAKLLSACETDRAECVLVWDLSRLGRQGIDTIIDLYNLAKLNKVIIDAKGVTYDLKTLEGQFTAILSANKNKMESDDKSDAVCRGKQRAREKGSCQGKPPIGYESKPVKDEGTYWVKGDPDEMKLVEELFTMYSNGSTLLQIATLLNQRGTQTPAGSFWSSSGIRHILTNPTYGGFQCKKDNPTDKWKANIEVFLDQELWIKVYGDLMSRGKRKSPKPRRKYPLTGTIVCGECGLTANVRGGSPRYAKRYGCRSAENNGCESGSFVLINELHDSIIGKWNVMVQNNGIEKLAKKAIEVEYKSFKQSFKSASTLIKKREELEEKKDRYLDAFESGDLTPKQVGRRTKEIEDQLESLQDKLEDLEIEDMPIPLEEAVAVTQDILEGVDNLSLLVDFIDNLEIVGMNRIKLKMFGKTSTFNVA